MGAYSAILAYLVKVVTLTTPTHVANIANEWLPIQRYGRYTCCIIYKLKVKIKNPPPSSFDPFCVPISKLLSPVLPRAPNITLFILYLLYLVCNYLVCNQGTATLSGKNCPESAANYEICVVGAYSA